MSTNAEIAHLDFTTTEPKCLFCECSAEWRFSMSCCGGNPDLTCEPCRHEVIRIFAWNLPEDPRVCIQCHAVHHADPSHWEQL